MRWGFVAAVALTLVAVLLSACGGRGDEAATSAETAAPSPPESVEPPPSETAPPPPAETEPPPPATELPPPPATAAPQPALGPLTFPAGQGALVWNETDVDPERLAAALRESGFDWAALRLHDGLTEDPVDPRWIERFRAAGGPHLGGWGVLRDQPEEEAALAQRLVAGSGLAFYVANAEADYAYTGVDGQSPERHGRSSRFVRAFRALAPELPAALSSYCRADRHDLDWAAWRGAGFAFFPQAYVNDFGPDVAPAVCLDAARAHFDPAQVHPTIGSYPGRYPVGPPEYAELLAQAGANGFSVYPAEVAMTDEGWQTLGAVG